ncbi:hypothetical protein Q7C36_022255 [Tachysurus vachellii]|uniref:TNF family profile domain-containing protein n=1 Tax=Tachysurus vachellii TaxID=175792 RepID=A0AA88J776_TACVA|nr:uncharacterized protein LOC132839805 [Tachysurus vachellii]KAK2818322.1 hypothetical protein Q7C36_022255 [Tachysurus vachellii]
MSSTDVESLQPVPRQRSRCLDVFLLCSVIILFVMVLSGLALGFWVIKDLRAEMKPPFGQLEGIKSPIISDIPKTIESSYKAQNFAYFIPQTGEVKNASMLWKPIEYLNSSTIGSSYSFEPTNGVLTVNRDASYFLYTQLNLTCVHRCGKGTLSVTFENNKNEELLTCSLHLPKMPSTSNHVVEKCWTVIPHLVKGTRLNARMHGFVAPQGWSLDLNHSGFGMFLIE